MSQREAKSLPIDDVIFLDSLFPTESTKTQKWVIVGEYVCLTKEGKNVSVFSFLRGTCRAQVNFQGSFYSAQKEKCTSEGRFLPYFQCQVLNTHTPLHVCTGSPEDAFSPASPFPCMCKGARCPPSHLRAPRHLHRAGRSNTGPRINLSPSREAKWGKAGYPGNLRDHHLPTFGQLNLTKEV